MVDGDQSLGAGLVEVPARRGPKQYRTGQFGGQPFRMQQGRVRGPSGHTARPCCRSCRAWDRRVDRHAPIRALIYAGTTVGVFVLHGG